MAHRTRRSVSRLGGVVATAALASRRVLAARPRVLDQPPGLQPWTVKQELARDFDGTLGRSKSLGHARVEAAGRANRSPEVFGQGVRATGLDGFSRQFSMRDLIDEHEGRLAAARRVGTRHLVASSPATTSPLVGLGRRLGYLKGLRV